MFSFGRHGRVNDVQEALDNGFPIDDKDEMGNTLLMVAAQVKALRCDRVKRAICLSVSLSVRPCVCLSVPLSVWLPVCPLEGFQARIEMIRWMGLLALMRLAVGLVLNVTITERTEAAG